MAKNDGKAAKEPDRVLVVGQPDFGRCDNQVTTARYTAITFFPVVRQCRCSNAARGVEINGRSGEGRGTDRATRKDGKAAAVPLKIYPSLSLSLSLSLQLPRMFPSLTLR